MRKLLISLFPVIFFFYPGCSNDGGGSTDPFGFGGGGGGGTGNVTMQIDIGYVEDPNDLWFAFSPSVQVKVDNALVTQTQLGINETVNNPDAGLVCNTGEWYAFYQVPQQAQIGQQWSFRFTGTVVQGGQAFTATVSYTIQQN